MKRSQIDHYEDPFGQPENDGTGDSNRPTHPKPTLKKPTLLDRLTSQGNPNVSLEAEFLGESKRIKGGPYDYLD